MFPRFDEKAERTLLAKGMNASPGAAVGKAVFDWATAVEWAERGEDVILVRKETTPEDLHGMMVARGVLTSRGGKTSHAAVVARGMGRTCVCGAEALDVDAREGHVQGPRRHDGQRGRRDLDRRLDRRGVPRRGPGHRRPRWCATSRARRSTSRLVEAVTRLMEHADAARRMKVRTNADTAEDAARARRFGAQGIGLCRTEHMFLGERRQLVENLIVADDEEGQEAALAELLPAAARTTSPAIFEAMDGLPVTIRLIDPPLHEFLPDLTELSVQAGHRRLARPRARSGTASCSPRSSGCTSRTRCSACAACGSASPSPACSPCRPGRSSRPRPTRLKAGGEAEPGDHDPAGRVGAGAGHRPRPRSTRSPRTCRRSRASSIPHLIGTMIELPRAALTADKIAGSADFFSFGTNDLTQMTWGFSRDDVEASFFSTYLEQGIFPVSPFESPGHRGRRARWYAAPRGRPRGERPTSSSASAASTAATPPRSTSSTSVGLDYVSCSPFRVPVARLEAGRSALSAG